MPRPKPILACDCETDPFLHGRKPEPFLWGLYDGKRYNTFDNTADFVAAVCERNCILYAHNGGKFDFIYLLPFVRYTKAQIINGRIVSMYLGKCELRDSFAIIPVALKEFGGKKEIDYQKLERHCRDDHMEEIKEYLFHDCKSLYDGVSAYRHAAGRYKTIASNALAFCKKQGVDPGKTNHRFDCNFRPYYFGGRTECFQPGEHRNLTLLDIHSAYPFAMTHNHATGTEFRHRSEIGDLTCEEIQRAFITLECTSRGAFPLRTKGAQGLIFPHEYNLFHVTGWEYVAALELGLLDNVNIVDVAYTAETINFKAYVSHWFEYKASHDKAISPMGYTIGKIMMNSLYGKLAQNPARYYDYVITEAGTPVNRNEGWTLEHEYEGHEIHRRESLWKYKHTRQSDGTYTPDEDWITRKLYKNVATGASITGFTRAHLLRAIHAVGVAGVVYCDTDGIVAKGDCNVGALTVSPAIGDWGIDDTGAPVGYFAGKKLYAIRLSNGKTKIASKGTRLTFEEVKRISEGETVTWMNAAPSFSIAGAHNFVVRKIRSTAFAK